MTDTDSLRSL